MNNTLTSSSLCSLTSRKMDENPIGSAPMWEKCLILEVKQPWDSSWKTNCKLRIKSCDAMIVLVSENTENADGAIWEINCAKDLGLKIRGIYIKNGSILNKPSEMFGILCEEWTWENVKDFIEKA